MRHITDLDSGRVIEADRQISDPSELPKLTALRQVRSRGGHSHLSEFVLFTLGASMHECKIKVLPPPSPPHGQGPDPGNYKYPPCGGGVPGESHVGEANEL